MAAAAAVIAVSLGGLLWTGVIGGPRTPPTPPRVLVAQAADAWLAAWSSSEVGAMARLTTAVGDRSSVRAAVKGLADDLGHPPLTVTRGRVRVLEDRASVAFTAAADLDGLGTWQWAGRLRFARTEREGGTAEGDDHDAWRVLWSPDLLHPSLVGHARIERVLRRPARAPLLAHDGTPLGDSPFASLAGAVGPVSAADAPALGRWYRAGDVVGSSGLQATFERRLAGTPSTEVRLVGTAASPTVLASFPGIVPAPVRLSLDPDAQAAAEAALDAGLAARQRADVPPLPLKQAAMVVVQPSTGGLLARVSRPKGGFDRALQGHYPPGSTFKVVTTIGLLEKGVTSSTTVSCPKTATVGGREFHNAEGHELGNTPFRRAFAESCNTAFVQLAEKLTHDEFKALADSLGFNRPVPLSIPVSASSVPLPHSAVDQAASAIGQARVSVTPFQMAMVMAAVASGGPREPRLVDEGPPAAVRPFPPGVQQAMASLLQAVVTEGTGQRARVAGTPVAGKTGTAEFGVEHPPHVHAWFVAYRGDLAIAILLEDAGFGGEWAAPVAADFFRRMS